MKKNFFIAFEGLDGSGKSTQVKLLTEKLKGQSLKIYTTAEPTTSRIGQIIKDIFKHKWKLTTERSRRFMLQTGWIILQIKQRVS
jgi:thymidylate kinase